MKEALSFKISIQDSNANINQLQGNINKFSEKVVKNIETNKGEMNAVLSQKADCKSIQDILDVSINKQNLEAIDEQIVLIQQRIDQVEEDLKSNSSENEEEESEDEGETHDQEQSSIKENYQEQTSIQENTEEYDEAISRKQTNAKSKLSFAILDNGDMKKVYDSINDNRNKKYKHKRSQHLLNSNHKFGGSDSSTNKDDLRNSKETPLENQIAKKSKKSTKMDAQILKGENSKISIETPFTQVSSTHTLINKLWAKSDKNKSKKVSRSEMEMTMKIINEIFLKVNNNRMRLDTLEGNVELKIDTLISNFRTECTTENKTFHDLIRKDNAALHTQLDGFERLNYRLNSKILEKPYKYADGLKEAVDREQKDIKTLINRKYDLLLNRIVSLKQHQQNIEENGINSQTFNINEEQVKHEIKLDFENSKLMMMQSDLEDLRKSIHDELLKLNKQIVDLKHEIDEFKENVDYQVFDFKSTTSQEINDSLKEFQNFDRELKRHQNLYREILIKYNKLSEKDNKNKSITSREDHLIDPSAFSKKRSTRLHSISPSTNLLLNKNKSSARYKLSKSVLEPSIEPRSKSKAGILEVEVTAHNKSMLPKIASHQKTSKVSSTLMSPRANHTTLNARANYEINKTLQKIHNSDNFNKLKQFYCKRLLYI